MLPFLPVTFCIVQFSIIYSFFSFYFPPFLIFHSVLSQCPIRHKAACVVVVRFQPVAIRDRSDIPPHTILKLTYVTTGRNSIPFIFDVAVRRSPVGRFVLISWELYCDWGVVKALEALERNAGGETGGGGGRAGRRSVLDFQIACREMDSLLFWGCEKDDNQKRLAELLVKLCRRPKVPLVVS